MTRTIASAPTLQTPSSLVLFITGRCNAACSHCFYAEHLNRDDDAIDLPRFTSIVASLTQPTMLSLTGGEPFVLKEFQAILDAAFAAPMVSSVTIPTNGYYVDRIKSIVTHVNRTYDKHLHLQLSLDGTAAMHDGIRGLRNGYERVLETAQWLQAYGAEHPRLSYTVSTTVMQRNLHDVRALVGELHARGLNHKLTFVRGNSFSTFNVPEVLLRPDYESGESLPESEAIERLVEEIGQAFPDFFSEFGRKKVDTTLSVLKSRNRVSACYAGSKDGVVFHDGTVGLCEQVVAFGHLSQWNWDLHAAWNSPEAEAHRKRLRGCSCIHGCNISTAVMQG